MIVFRPLADEEGGVPTAIFSQVKANLIEQNVTAGVEAYRAGHHDGVIAFGGGSALTRPKPLRSWSACTVV